MEFPLEGGKRRMAALFLSLTAAAVLVFQASELWLANQRIHSGQLDLMQRGAALEPSNGEAWDRLGRLLQYDFQDSDLSQAILDYEKAVKDDPLSAHYWMNLASAYEEAGEPARAREAFERAKSAYPISAEVAFQYGNFLLRQQKYPEAYAEIQQAVRTDPTLLPLAISRAWRASEDIDQLLNQMLPADTQAYLQALDFLASIQQAQPALAVWQRLVSLGRPFPLAETFPFFDELIREDRADDARKAWREALAATGIPHEEPADRSLIWNGDFARDFANGGLDWRWTPFPGVLIDFDSTPAPNRSRAVRLDFSGGANVNLDAPLEYVPVAPGSSYHFHAYVRTVEIATESGMRFSLADPNHPGALDFLSDNFTGSHAWTRVDADVTTGPQTHFLAVRLLRRTSNLFENKLSGTAWIADVSLIPLNAPPEQPSQ